MLSSVPVDPAVWWACAGRNVKIPSVGSRVVYFPEGHAEQCQTTNIKSPPSSRTQPWRVASVNFMVDPENDEIFARISLDPNILPIDVVNPPPEALQACSKILTASDANNGGGFSIPKFCADTIFPSLDFKIDNPAQQLNIRSLAGRVYPFRHIYRGTPKRHLLTTGWSKYVNDKRLVAGDTVIFIKKSPNEIFIGVRPKYPLKKEKVEMAKAAEGVDGSFEVDYYPWNGFEQFVVAEEVVTDAMKVGWRVGMRVRMRVEQEDSGRTVWHAGTVESVEERPRSWSPWRMLKIRWDEQEVMHGMQYVSPWQVEIIPATTEPEASNLAIKRTKVSQISNDEFGNLSMLRFNPVPTDMQGARHKSSNNNYISNNDPPLQYESVVERDGVQNKISSPHGHERISNDCNSTERCKRRTFKLFGQIIQTVLPPETGDNGDHPKE